MNFLYRVGHFTVRSLARLFYGHKIYGINQISPGSAILAANHASFFDPPLIGCSWPEGIHFLARDSLLKVPLIGPLLPKLNVYPVKQGGADLATMKLLAQGLKRGEKILIFPEGTRSQDGHLQRMRGGVALLARLAQCSIIPVYIAGTYDVWSRGHRFPKLWGKTACVFGSPILWKDFERLDKKEADLAITHRLQESIEKLRDWYEAGARGTPP